MGYEPNYGGMDTMIADHNGEYGYNEWRMNTTTDYLYRYFLLYICYVKNHESSSEIHWNQSPIPGYKLLMPIQIIYVTIRIQIRICMYLLQ